MGWSLDMRFIEWVDFACSGQMTMRTMMVRQMMARPQDWVVERLSRRRWRLLSSQLSGRETNQNQPYCMMSPQPSPRLLELSSLRSMVFAFGPMKMR